jgi:hypothetical protein
MSKENTYPAKRNTTLIRNQKERKLQPTLSPCDAAAILQSENNVENTNCPHSLLHIPPPPTHCLKTTRSHKKYNTPNPECMQNCNHRKLQNNNNNNNNNNRTE